MAAPRTRSKTRFENGQLRLYSGWSMYWNQAEVVVPSGTWPNSFS